MIFDPHIDITDPRLIAASRELEARIGDKYPEARFSRLWLDDPEGMHLRVVASVTDPEEIFDLVGEQLLHFQVDEGFPLYLVPLRPVGEVVKQPPSKTIPIRPP